MPIYTKPLILKWGKKKKESREEEMACPRPYGINSKIQTLPLTGRCWGEDTSKLITGYFPQLFIPSPHTQHQYTKDNLPFLIHCHSLRGHSIPAKPLEAV